MGYDEDDHLAGEVNPWVMSAYITYSMLLVAKLLVNVLLMVLISLIQGKTKVEYDSDADKKKTIPNPTLNRVVRIHQNDLENILPFLMLGFLYVMVWFQPYHRARWHFRIFFWSRMLTSIFHFFAIQPLRSISFSVAFIVNISLAGHIFYKAAPFALRYL